MKFRLATILLINNIRLTYSCIRTSDVGVTTTLPITVAPTTAAPTTTVPTTTLPTTIAAACNMCNAMTLPSSDPNDPNTMPPMAMPGPNDANGCSVLNLSCTPRPPITEAIINNYSLVGTDIGQAGVLGQGNPATATYVCNAMGQWTFTEDMITTVIGTAVCFG